MASASRLLPVQPIVKDALIRQQSAQAARLDLTLLIQPAIQSVILPSQQARLEE